VLGVGILIMENQNEIWKDIPNYEGYYQVSNHGRVKSLSRFVKNKYEGLTYWKERILKPTLSSGYYVIKLLKEQKKIIKVHQLVAIAFLNHKPCGMLLVVDHINNIKTDNRLDNLQVITNRKNLSKDKNGTSKYTGVSWSKRYNKWESNIYINGKNIFLGHFESEKEASIIYQKKLNTLNK
jgi:hypothetical protein